MTSIASGLGKYEIIKTGFSVFILICCMYIAVGLTARNLLLNYVSTTGTIALNSDNISETLTYKVNNKIYTHIIEAKYNDKTKISTPAHYVGEHKIYYSNNNPNIYSIGTNPTLLTSGCSVCLCILAGFAFAWFLFLRSNREVASVVGGISAANTILGNLNK